MQVFAYRVGLDRNLLGQDRLVVEGNRSTFIRFSTHDGGGEKLIMGSTLSANGILAPVSLYY